MICALETGFHPFFLFLFVINTRTCPEIVCDTGGAECEINLILNNNASALSPRYCTTTFYYKSTFLCDSFRFDYSRLKGALQVQEGEKKKRERGWNEKLFFFPFISFQKSNIVFTDLTA